MRYTSPPAGGPYQTPDGGTPCACTHAHLEEKGRDQTHLRIIRRHHRHVLGPHPGLHQRPHVHPHQRRLIRVTLALPVEAAPHLLARVVVVVVLVALRKVPALRVDEHERLRRFVGPLDGIRQVDE